MIFDEKHFLFSSIFHNIGNIIHFKQTEEHAKLFENEKELLCLTKNEMIAKLIDENGATTESMKLHIPEDKEKVMDRKQAMYGRTEYVRDQNVVREEKEKKLKQFHI